MTDFRHHYIPCFYTKRWLDNDGKIRCHSYQRGNINLRLWSPKGTGYEFDLYGLSEHENKNIIEEEHFKPIDNDANLVLDKLITHGVDTLNDNERRAWSLFLSSLLVRHKNIVEGAKANAIKIMDDLSKIAVNHLPDEIKSDYLGEIDSHKEDLGVHTIAHMIGRDSSPIPIEKNNIYTNILNDKKWQLVDFSNIDIELITSDYPVIFLPRNGLSLEGGDFQGIMSHTNTVVALPLSPSLSFYASTGGFNMESSNLKALAKQQNKKIVQLAKSYIYSYSAKNDRLIFAHFKKPLS